MLIKRNTPNNMKKYFLMASIAIILHIFRQIRLLGKKHWQ